MTKILAALGLLAIIAAAAWAFMSYGPAGREPAEWLIARPVAHRGFWTEGPERPENSLAAFDAAAAKGYAIELDVHSSAEGVTIVFHDSGLARMTGEDSLVEDLTLEELKALRLLGGKEPIPTLEEVLALVDGRVPVFVEIKNEDEVGALEDDVAKQLADYDGDACVMSFNPYSLARVAEAAPDIQRGQLSGGFEGEDLAWYKKLLLKGMLMNWTSKPDFIAYELTELPSIDVTAQRWRGRPVLVWTIDDADDLAVARMYADGGIFDPSGLEAQ
ncbi:MAG: glycerophosphodiester phosphodiesterase [Actinobacteria bacterium]|nr:glycerophosphodiester phosphodiesterase [Actinomycetota bacterium]